MSMLLSANDSALIELPHKIGDKFHFNGKTEYYHETIRKELDNRDIFVEIESIELFEDGTFGYRLKFLRPQYKWKWSMLVTTIETEFIALEGSLRDSRFTMLE